MESRNLSLFDSYEDMIEKLAVGDKEIEVFLWHYIQYNLLTRGAIFTYALLFFIDDMGICGKDFLVALREFNTTDDFTNAILKRDMRFVNQFNEKGGHRIVLKGMRKRRVQKKKGSK